MPAAALTALVAAVSCWGCVLAMAGVCEAGEAAPVIVLWCDGGDADRTCDNSDWQTNWCWTQNDACFAHHKVPLAATKRESDCLYEKSNGPASCGTQNSRWQDHMAGWAPMGTQAITDRMDATHR